MPGMTSGGAQGPRGADGCVVVFDTETTGLPQGRVRPTERLAAWDGCRMVQIAWAVYQPMEPMRQGAGAFVIRPAGAFVVPEAAARIHGITTERAEREGQPVRQVLLRFLEALRGAGTLVAHNLAFDEGVVESELVRAGMGPGTQEWRVWESVPRRVCTMRRGTAPGGRWPRLAALYEQCFGEAPDPSTLHRADVDTELCARIFFHQEGHC